MGWHELNKLDIESIENFYSARDNEIDYLMEQQFSLTYYTNMSYSDVANMTPFELETMLNKLRRVKEIEQEKLMGVGDK